MDVETKTVPGRGAPYWGCSQGLREPSPSVTSRVSDSSKRKCELTASQQGREGSETVPLHSLHEVKLNCAVGGALRPACKKTSFHQKKKAITLANRLHWVWLSAVWMRFPSTLTFKSDSPTADRKWKLVSSGRKRKPSTLCSFLP